MPTLTVLIPVYNEPEELRPSIESVAAAAGRAPDFEVDVLVVDDGSTDGTAAAARAVEVAVPVRVLSLPENRGRLLARIAGLGEAGGEYALLLDAGIELDPDALAFVAERLRDEQPQQVWNGHVEIEAGGSPLGLFWKAVTGVAWHEYHRDPRTTTYGVEEFDRFPKGAGCFFAPRALLVEAYGESRSLYSDLEHASSDTRPLRHVADRARIGISPGFACRYRPRGTLAGFARHAYYRGIHFPDSHARPGTRFFPAVLAYYPLSAALAAAALRRPAAGALLLLGGAAAAGATAAAFRRPRGEVASVAALAPVFALAHGAGMWRGLGMAATSALRRRGR